MERGGEREGWGRRAETSKIGGEAATFCRWNIINKSGFVHDRVDIDSSLHFPMGPPWACYPAVK